MIFDPASERILELNVFYLQEYNWGNEFRQKGNHEKKRLLL